MSANLPASRDFLFTFILSHIAPRLSTLELEQAIFSTFQIAQNMRAIFRLSSLRGANPSPIPKTAPKRALLRDPILSDRRHGLRSEDFKRLFSSNAIASESPDETTENDFSSSTRILESERLSSDDEDARTHARSQASENKTPLWRDYSDRLDPMILETMQKNFKYNNVTKVQQTILDLMPLQHDLLVRSKTGTGKTLAFLVPALQSALKNLTAKNLTGAALKDYANKHASIFIISPTRELANQIATEARRLVTVPGSNMKALCLVGGDSKKVQLKLMRRERNDFVVGTPGRLLDLLENDPEFAEVIENVQTLILDEADTLLEMGFRSELQRILRFLPGQRQTLMFSATVSKDIQGIARLFLGKDHKFINTVSKDEQDVHTRIKQEYIIRPAVEHMKIVLSLLISQQLKNPLSKVIVFLPTTKITMLYASCFKTLRRLYPNPAFQQFDIHAQRTQDSRAKVSKAFREANAGTVLFTTDVSARGVDYPGVLLVIQVGSANSRDLYIHRIGRTGRAGKEGQGILILQPFEKEYLRTLGKDIPLVQKDFPDSEIALGTAQQKVFDLMRKMIPLDLLEEAFLSLAGSMIPRSRDLRSDKEAIVDGITAFYKDLAGESAHVPAISQRLLGSSGFDRSDRNDRREPRFEYGSTDRGRAGPPRQFRRSPEMERRPRRPSEILPDGRRRKDFSRRN